VGSTTGTYTVAYATGRQAQILGDNGIPGFRTQAEAQAYAMQQDNVFALSTNPLQAGYQVITGQATARGSASSNSPLAGLAAIGDFFSRLTEKNTWLRAVKILAGGMLIIIGMAHMTGADNAVAAAARKIPVIV
jgi:hypothetical protein